MPFSYAEERPAPCGGPGTLCITDERTGKQYSIKLNDHGHLKAADLKQITAGGDGVGLRTYDPGYSHWSMCCWQNPVA